MACQAVAGDLRDLIGPVLLSIAMGWEVLVNARVDGSEDEMEHDDVAGGEEVKQLDLDFIDDETNFQDQEPTDYCLMNITRDLQDAIADRSMVFDLDLVVVDPENFVSDFADEVSYEFDEFFGFEKCIPKFDEELQIFEKESKDSFYFSILYAIYYHLLEEKEDFYFCQDEEILGEV